MVFGGTEPGSDAMKCSIRIVISVLAVLLALPVLAACDDDDDDNKTTTPQPATMTQPTATATQLLITTIEPPATTTQPPNISEESNPFTIVVLPDTQYYAISYPETFRKQTKWIVAQKEALNIVGVVHEGDITNLNTKEEWEVAEEAMGLLDDVVPYFPTVGNHDYVSCVRWHVSVDRDTTLFNEYFGPQRFEKYSWYGGHFPGGNENAFYLLDAEGIRFLIVCLEFYPNDEVLHWAGEILALNKDRRAIIVTHSYTNWDDIRVGEADDNNPRKYRCTVKDGNDGDQMWEKLVKNHKNVFLVLSGHIYDKPSADGVGRLESIGANGNTVHQVVANYQYDKNGGNGWLRIMKFVPAEDKIVVTTFSPTLNEYRSDPDNEFEIQYSH